MGISRFLTHRVSIVRKVAVLDGDDPTYDSHGQPVFVDQAVASLIPASIQPKRAREQAAINQAGVPVADHTVYLLPVDVSTADVIVHDEELCPMTTDLPDATYRVTAVPSAAGIGHHLEIDAKLVASTKAYATPVGS
jgi:hypothetical protein